MHRKRRRILCIVTVLIMPVLLLTGCVADIDGKYKGLSIGFNYKHSLVSVVAAVRSDKTEFNVNDVTLDFYFGRLWDTPVFMAHDGSPKIVIYFRNGGISSALQPQADYKKVDGLVYVAEISAKEFDSEDIYKVMMTKRDGKTFRSKITTIVPKEFFDKIPSGHIYFDVWSVEFSNENVMYHLSRLTNSHINCITYEYIGENTVKLS